MGALTDATPKPLLQLQGRPILEHVLSGLRDAGASQAVVVTGYLGEQIEHFFGDGRRIGLPLRYVRQPRAEGTARALLLVRQLLERQPFFLSWGDIVIDPSQYPALVSSFETANRTADSAPGCAALLALNYMEDPWRGAAVYVDGSWRVSRLVEKPPRGASTTHWNNAGIFVFDPVILEYAERLQPSERGEYELPQAIAAMISDGRLVCGYPLQGFWSDLGTPEDLAEAERAFRHAPASHA